MTRNIDMRSNLRNRNERSLNHSPSNNWRASLVPAAAVIPAPIAYIKVVAVKKLVVGFLFEIGSETFVNLSIQTFFYSSVAILLR